jgi:hypothetical protein
MGWLATTSGVKYIYELGIFLTLAIQTQTLNIVSVRQGGLTSADRLIKVKRIHNRPPRTAHNLVVRSGNIHVRWVPCHHGMVRPQVADGGDAL